MSLIFPVRLLWVAGLSLTLLSACSDKPEEAAPAPAATPTQADTPPIAASTEDNEPDRAEAILLADRDIEHVEVEETFVTALTPDDNIDSVAVWQDGSGNLWLYATTKDTDRINMYEGEAGFLKGAFGGEGTEPGKFDRPNGVFVIRDLMLVVESDNHRVQVLSLPSMKPLGFFGEDKLRSPYGLWVRSLEVGYEAIISDAYMSEEDAGETPPTAELGERFQRFTFDVVDGELSAEWNDNFGATDSAGAIRIAESLVGDEGQRRLLIAEEEQSFGTRLKVYDMDGQYASQDVGADVFKAQAEGIALFNCADGSGYLIAADQFKDRSLFHVFDRQSLALIGSFAGKVTANTDGVWLHQAPSKLFPNGVFYAVHDDQAVAAFDWRAIAEGLGIRATCY